MCALKYVHVYVGSKHLLFEILDVGVTIYSANLYVYLKTASLEELNLRTFSLLTWQYMYTCTWSFVCVRLSREAFLC